MVVRIVDIGGFIYHHCLNSLFIKKQRQRLNSKEHALRLTKNRGSILLANI